MNSEELCTIVIDVHYNNIRMYCEDRTAPVKSEVNEGAHILTITAAITSQINTHWTFWGEERLLFNLGLD